MGGHDHPFAEIERTFKKAAGALQAAEVPFLLGGAVASWAYGGPESRNDLDFMIKPEDAERALQALVDAGMRAEDPPEEWLVKAWDGDVLVDLIFWPKGLPIDDDVIARGEELAVLSMTMRVMALEDVLITKLMAISEHHLRFESLIAIARALRERIDWPHVRAATASSPFARAFFVMVEGLEIVPSEHDEPGSGVSRGPTVRVVTDAGSPAAAAG